ncbi:MAG: hypothetical protein CGU28_06145 [Candidatus Dactylopiibacterium carminicum]|uniref:DUF4136 domain-containing protein n=1 Tax=Candidatus Dactylopiibacterium carminicum TaxID=857335 RepID=A0A272ENF0_9RHOO|nr:hypothetical protein [Candidatus Dactylopiibacterium carminicum]KAF7599252.1 hypothetical protein BGI27_08665 [Candidatus Dactylopiibacterium carminicum]PAS91645.1 MAG: hypothetical protein CGU29_15210 [Candidatus Dactylopiibacterium carminicum]PAS97197.1 MAG: hypothetical protein CGU28_06145 [Candidatus Dactylopiibacterium carminicum]PAS99258.1 MAG: hypothetical protein BSR46_08700 [Candidatus Dactylopiibacterium carminicum]
MKNFPRLLALAVLALLLGACATANYYPHEARENVHQGKGGSRFQYEGLDVWFIGEPDRRYKILGYIEDSVSSTVDDQHRRISSEVAKKAHEIGADALIEVVTSRQADSSVSIGSVFGGRHSGFGMGFGFPVTEQQNARYTAIKFLD